MRCIAIRAVRSTIVHSMPTQKYQVSDNWNIFLVNTQVAVDKINAKIFIEKFV